MREAAWAPLLVFFVHILATRVLALYTRFPTLDVPMHLAGGTAMCFFLSRCYRAAADAGLLGRPAALVRVVLLFTSTSTIAVFWELTEFVSDATFRTHAQLGLADTLGDLLLGMVGCVVFLAASRALASAPRTPGVALGSATEELPRVGGGTVETRWPEP